MRVEVRVVLFGMVFVGTLAVIYWFTSYEQAGTTMLVLGAAMYAIMCGYLYLQSRRLAKGPPGRRMTRTHPPRRAMCRSASSLRPACGRPPSVSAR